MTAPAREIFVGRAGECAHVRSALAAAEAGHGRLVLITGEPGIGKSRLVVEALREVSHPVLHARGTPLVGPTLPYGIWLDALGDIGSSVPVERADSVSAATLDALRYETFESVFAVLRKRCATGPTVLVLDDLQWADLASMDLLLHICQRFDDLALTVIGTTRPVSDPREEHRARVLRHLRAAGTTQLVDLDRLPEEEIRQIIAAVAPDRPAAQVERSTVMSDGNPLFAIECARTPGATLPARLGDVIAIAIEPLSVVAREALDGLAVLGRTAQITELAQVVAADTVDAALGELLDATIVVAPAPETLRIKHQLVADYVYDHLASTQRRRLHERMAHALTGRADTPAAELAEHWDRAGCVEPALVESVRAGIDATGRLAVVEADVHLRRALRLWPAVTAAPAVTSLDHAELLLLAGQAAMWCGRVDEAGPLFDRALAESTGELAAESLAWAARVQDAQGNGVAAIAIYEDGIARAISAGASALAARMRARRAALTMQLGSSAQALAAAREAGDYARAVNEPLAEVYARSVAGFAAARLGDYERALQDLTAAADRAATLGTAGVVERLRADIGRAAALDRLGELAAAADASRRALDEALTVGLVATYGTVAAANLADQLYLLGEWDDGLAIVRAALDYPAGPQYHAYLAAIHGQYLVGRGEIDDAVAVLAGAARDTDLDYPDFGLPVLAAQVEAHLWSPDPGRSLAPLRAGLALVAGDDDAAHREWWRALALRVEVATGIREPAPDAVVTGERSRPDVLAWRVTGAAEATRLGARPSAKLWSEALLYWQQLGVVPRQLYAGLRLVEACLAAGQRDRARRIASDTLATARRIGAAGVADAVAAVAGRARLALTDPPATTTAPAPMPTLTERERQVIALVAAGMTNEQIGRRLFISPRTAGVHVANCLRKLDVRRRSELAALFARLDSGS